MNFTNKTQAKMFKLITKAINLTMDNLQVQDELCKLYNLVWEIETEED